MTTTPSILYCHCAYAQVVPKTTKEAVLKKLCETGVAFEAVADLCEMAARKDPALKRLAGCASIKVAACHARAVKGLFQTAGAPLPANTSVILDMRSQPADTLVAALTHTEPNPSTTS